MVSKQNNGMSRGILIRWLGLGFAIATFLLGGVWTLSGKLTLTDVTASIVASKVNDNAEKLADHENRLRALEVGQFESEKWRVSQGKDVDYIKLTLDELKRTVEKDLEEIKKLIKAERGNR